ncbi:N-acetyltransferase [Polaribacter sp. WD7]|uniref:GNAT family N-acetyltransferase n=1 Tax=Polaribacter sp. WD7 TaxID=2269061 RepID=UPI000DF35F51|nr:GNAT family protein [Polaribacter sp. WD7]RCS27521.1 N-acetyltransferase [Polaribacter sp. WD7]
MIVDIETHRLELLQEKDYWKICDFMVSNENRFKTYLPSTLAQNLTPELSKQFIKSKIQLIDESKEYVFVLKNTIDKTIDGIFYLKEIDNVKKQAEFAYGIGYQIKNKGFATKVVRKLSNFAFLKLKLKKLQIISHKTNIASIRVAQNCNFSWIKTLEKSFTPPNSKSQDMELYELHYER